MALPTVKDLKVFDETSTTMKVTWVEPVGGASGYMLRYRPLNTAQPEPEKEVESQSISLLGLQETALCPLNPDHHGRS